MSSRQLIRYLTARHVDGMTREDAAFHADISLGEAELHDAAVAAGEQPIPNPEMPRQGLPEPTADRGSTPAPAAVPVGAVNVTPVGAVARYPSEAGADRQPPTERKPAMARGKKKAEDKVEIIEKPDFERAIRVMNQDVLPAEQDSASTRGDLSAAWKIIEKDCHCNKAAAKDFHKLKRMAEENRDDYLRTLYGLMQAGGIGISQDLVDQMSDDGDVPSMPVIATKGLGISGLAASSVQ